MILMTFFLSKQQNKKNSALAEQLKEQELFFKTQINDLERDYEEKINVLLQEIRNVDIESKY